MLLFAALGLLGLFFALVLKWKIPEAGTESNCP
jgi:hypothetical protein